MKRIFRGVILVLCVLTILLTFKTLVIGFILTSISQQNIEVETWRETAKGNEAANNVYLRNQEIRKSFYESEDAYERWLSNASEFVQISITFALIAASVLAFILLYTYFNSRYKRLVRRIKKSNSRRKNIKKNLIY